MFLEKLSGRFSKARFLLVIQTKALYRSKVCLREIHKAYEKGVTVIPLGFENCMSVKTKDQWIMITEDSLFEDKQMLDSGERFASPFFPGCNLCSYPLDADDRCIDCPPLLSI